MTGERKATHEIFAYVITGTLRAEVAGRHRRAGPGGVIHVPRGAGYEGRVDGAGAARYATVSSTSRLEAAIAKSGAADNWRG